MSGYLVENRVGLFGSQLTLTRFHFSCFVLCIIMVIIKTQNRRSNNIQKTSLQSDKTQIKILHFPGLA